jgi:hypothetical protein
MPQTIEIFRAGTHTGVDRVPRTFTRADVEAIAAGYSQEAHAAPVVVGHPAADAPAYAWVGGLRAQGDVLVADIDQVDEAFAEMVKKGRFRHVSAAFYEPNDTHNPKPGQWSLRHVGFLGAQPPAVRGLKQVQFAAGDGFVAFMEPWQQGLVAGMFRRLREWMIGTAGQDAADQVLPTSEIDEVARNYPDIDHPQAMPGYSQPQKEPAVADPNATALAVAQAKLEADAAALAAEQARLQVERAAFSQAQAALRADEDAAFLDRLQAEGRALPANRADTLALLAHLPAEGEGASLVAFSEGEPRSPRQALKDLLARQPKLVAFGQHAPGTADPKADPTNTKDIQLKAGAYMQAMAGKGVVVTIPEAVRAVTEGEPA